MSVWKAEVHDSATLGMDRLETLDTTTSMLASRSRIFPTQLETSGGMEMSTTEPKALVELLDASSERAATAASTSLSVREQK
jgi:hypothetical protein